MKCIKDVEVRESLLFLRPTLSTWVDRIEQVSRSFVQSKDGYYLEPTLVGLLAGAAWANGVPAITEVKIKRSTGNSPEPNGRLDFLANYPEGRIAIEAKLIWDCMLVGTHVMATVRDACSEVLSVSRGKAEILLGAAFFVPWWNHEGQKAALEGKVLTPYEELRADIKACFYDPAIEFPGVILIAQLAQPPCIGVGRIEGH